MLLQKDKIRTVSRRAKTPETRMNTGFWQPGGVAEEIKIS